MTNFGDQFFAASIDAFHAIITDFNMTISAQDAHPGAGYMLTLQNKTTAITISYEVREWEVVVDLCKLSNGTVPLGPPYKYFCIQLQTILEARAPKYRLPSKWAKDYIRNTLQKSAESIQLFADDILRGDFSFFDTLLPVNH